MTKEEAREILQRYPLRFKTEQQALDYINTLNRHEIPETMGIMPFRFNVKNKQYEANPEYLEAHYELAAIRIDEEKVVLCEPFSYPVQEYD